MKKIILIISVVLSLSGCDETVSECQQKADIWIDKEGSEINNEIKIFEKKKSDILKKYPKISDCEINNTGGNNNFTYIICKDFNGNELTTYTEDINNLKLLVEKKEDMSIKYAIANYMCNTHNSCEDVKNIQIVNSKIIPQIDYEMKKILQKYPKISYCKSEINQYDQNKYRNILMCFGSNNEIMDYNYSDFIELKQIIKRLNDKEVEKSYLTSSLKKIYLEKIKACGRK